ncbi:ATP-dependent DNA helicase Q1-like [Rhynchophorus ferrugineus]|uniref:ATP-dependent DNA helicase n=1 Tax=Rhynchophorus ferrugineus TaxID=354439 RepID=A0A834IJ88_RHYFE|nr:hypothetical protein GWI33_004046 [Rhynchophorus ferrugineus]
MNSNCDYTNRLNEIDQEIEKLEDQKKYIDNKLKALKVEKEELRVQYIINSRVKKADISEWTKQDYPWSKKVYDILKSKFKYQNFRPNQLACLNAILSKNNVLLVMPTGGGKSLIYQLASLVTDNLSVVISPLISLIEDQLMALEKFGISAATVNSSIPKEIKKEATKKMLDNKLNIIFVTPEYISNAMIFIKNLTNLHKKGLLDRFVIDEVHCCSNWGHDFRPDYLGLSLLKYQFPSVPILGLTATATSHTLVDIQKILEIPDAVIITAPYNRPNLFYKVINKSDEKSKCIEYMAKLIKEKYANQSGIIYAGTQKDCEEIATELKKCGIKVAPYHANLENNVKSKIHRKWTENVYQVVVATIAFGMGIDKPDVRFVIHYTVPKSLEGLYQESGRAGRDGKRADCFLMFNFADWLKIIANVRSVREETSVTNILSYCIDISTCRRKLISKYFDDDWRSSDCSKMCDNCKKDTDTIKSYDITTYTSDLLKVLDKDINWTLKKFLDAWFQSGPKNLQNSSVPKPHFTRDDAKYILAYLLTKNILKINRGHSLVSVIPYIGINRTLSSGDKIIMNYSSALRGATVHLKQIAEEKESLSGEKIQNKRRKLL